MGDLLTAECSCGYKASLQVGLGFRYFEDKVYYEAAYCDHCGQVKAVSGGKDIIRCSHCRKRMRYYKEDLGKEPSPTIDSLPDTSYLDKRKYWHCPSCKMRNLTFNHSGLWD